MSYYTKEQLDELALKINQRIESATSTEALQTKLDGSIVTNAENITSYATALNDGYQSTQVTGGDL